MFKLVHTNVIILCINNDSIKNKTEVHMFKLFITDDN